ncbi:MAG TPA: hypothetical protein VGW98_02885 [Solirubrobacteraceae bacterium]|jgi:hypothetical protein|nr:hypothetical protein [Solirubrobacteraceae bacterium]
MYHLELRQFPHNLCRFNLTEQDLRALLAPWVLEKPLELGERKWSPHQATITVLEGPRLELQQLSMGRGWRTAQRASEDVTARVIAAASEARGAMAPGAPAQSPAGPPGAASGPSMDASLTADPLALGVQLASLLGGDPARLLAAWRQASAENPGRSPSETLALAEAALSSLRPDPGRAGDR